MGIRVAVASSDNIVVNQHFGHTQQFYIYDINGESDFQYIEERRVNPPCSIGEHNQSILEEAVQRVLDCQYVLCYRIGGGASNLLFSNGVHSYEIGDYIETSLNRLWDIVSRRDS